MRNEKLFFSQFAGMLPYSQAVIYFAFVVCILSLLEKKKKLQMIGGPLILLPIQILWINLVTDSATAISLSVEREEKNGMDEPPRQMNMPILNRMSFLLLTLFGSYIGVVAFILYSYYLNQSYQLANTVAFTAVVIMANIHVLNFRHLHGPVTPNWLAFE